MIFTTTLETDFRLKTLRFRTSASHRKKEFTMKRVVLSLIAVLILAYAAFGATSEDMSVYVRKDVFDVYMQNINVNTERILEELRVQREALIETKQNISVLSARIDGLDARIGDLRNDIYLGLVILGIIVALPTVQKMLQSHEERRDTRQSVVTLEDVKHLIEENNAKLQQKFQV